MARIRSPGYPIIGKLEHFYSNVNGGLLSSERPVVVDRTRPIREAFPLSPFRANNAEDSLHTPTSCEKTEKSVTF